MKTNGFEKMSKFEENVTYGGWAWLIALIPLVVQSIVTTVAAIKTLSSDGNGSIKTSSTGAVEAHWSEAEKGSKKSTKKADAPKAVYYAY